MCRDKEHLFSGITSSGSLDEGCQKVESKAWSVDEYSCITGAQKTLSVFFPEKDFYWGAISFKEYIIFIHNSFACPVSAWALVNLALAD